MKKRISKKVREEAALICAVYASTNWPKSVHEVAASVGASQEALFLSWEASDAAAVTIGFNGPICVIEAEAQAMLMDGWSPGDEP